MPHHSLHSPDLKLIYLFRQEDTHRGWGWGAEKRKLMGHSVRFTVQLILNLYVIVCDVTETD